MDIPSNCNVNTPEMTRFINATYYRGRYREKRRHIQELSPQEISLEVYTGRKKRYEQGRPA